MMHLPKSWTTWEQTWSGSLWASAASLTQSWAFAYWSLHGPALMNLQCRQSTQSAHSPAAAGEATAPLEGRAREPSSAPPLAPEPLAALDREDDADPMAAGCCLVRSGFSPCLAWVLCGNW